MRSQEEAERLFEGALRLAFQYTDDDGSGELDMEELFELLSSIGHEISRDGCFEIIKLVSGDTGSAKTGLTEIEFLETFRSPQFLALLTREEKKRKNKSSYGAKTKLEKGLR